MFEATLRKVKEAGEDFEWYPTTDEILAALVSDLSKRFASTHEDKVDVLDIGAGNGKVLDALAKAGRLDTGYVIEKSMTLVEQLRPEHVVIGTDFHQQALFDKVVRVTFCNPPYSEFATWATRIIRESSSEVVYLVIPQRWKQDEALKAALRLRETEAEVLGSFDFEDAEDRKARAKVDLLLVRLGSYNRYRGQADLKADPFDVFFQEQFKDLADQFKEGLNENPSKERVARVDELVGREDFIPALVALYEKDLTNLRESYAGVAKLSRSVLLELEVSVDQIKKLLRGRLVGLKSTYWQLVFDHMSKITSRLTTVKRRKMLEKLQGNSTVDFTIGNVLAILVWAIKNANQYTDEQLIEVYELMIDKANVFMYKSNKRLFVDERWRHKEENQSSHFGLETRLVVDRVGGALVKGDYWRNGVDGIETAAYDLVRDLVTVANNLGFYTPEGYGYSFTDYASGTPVILHSRNWQPGQTQSFYYKDENGEDRILMVVKAFKNRNLHIKLAKKFALALNVEFGRLRGWIRTPEEAAEELKDPQAAELFGCQALLPYKGSQLLLA